MCFVNMNITCYNITLCTCRGVAPPWVGGGGVVLVSGNTLVNLICTQLQLSASLVHELSATLLRY